MSFVRCTGIVIQVGPPGTPPEQAFDLAVEVVERNVSGEWAVEPLSEATRDYVVTRWSGRSIAVGRAWDIAGKLAADRDVVSAEPAFTTSGLEPDPADPEPQLAPHEVQPLPKSAKKGQPLPCAAENPVWSLDLCRVQDAWQLATSRGRGIVIGHPDTGYTRHDEIWNASPAKRRILPQKGYDYEDDKKDPRDPLDGKFPSHGTGTASVIMSDHNPAPDDEWVSGVAPRSKLIPFRVSDSVIHFSFTNLARSIHDGIDAGAHVISMSLGGPFPSGFLERAIERAVDSGVVLLAAAGNYWPWVVYPARYDEVIGVAAVNCQKEPWRHSARGESVDISAPGESVWRAETEAADPSNNYLVEMGSGTSFAVATTAGACALWLAHHGRQKLITRYGASNLTAVFREVLLSEGFERPSNWNDEKYGVGIVRADRLIAAPLPDLAPAAGVAPKTARGAQVGLDRFELIADYLPGVSRTRLGNALAALLRVPPAELHTALARYGDELVFQVATNPILRSTLYRATRRVAPKGASPRRGLSANKSLRANCSRDLRKAMGIEK